MADGTRRWQRVAVDRRRRRASALGLLVALVIALVPMPAEAQTDDTRPPAVDARVVGQVVDDAGRAVAGAPIVVRATDSGSGLGDLLFFGAFTLFTGGLGLFTCLLADGCPLVVGEDGVTAITRADGAGNYTATLPRSYVAGRETDTDWVIGAELDPRAGEVAGPSSSFEFEVNIQTQEAPPLPLWTTTPVVTVDGWFVRVDAARVPRDLRDIGFELVSDERSVHLNGESGTFDARLLERSAGSPEGLVVIAAGKRDVRVDHANGRTIYHQRVRSGGVSVPLDPVAPSRGSACSGLRRDGQAARVTGGAGCLLTDGRFEERLAPPPDLDAPATTAPDPTEPTQITVELDPPVDLGLVVLHGTSASMDVSASADGATWEPLRYSVQAAVGTAQPTGHVAARYVRVSGDAVGALTEISSWERTAGEDSDPPGPGTEVTVPRTDPSSPITVAGAGRDGGSGLGGALRRLVILLVVGLAIGAVVRKRKQATGRPAAPANLAVVPPPVPPASVPAPLAAPAPTEVPVADTAEGPAPKGAAKKGAASTKAPAKQVAAKKSAAKKSAAKKQAAKKVAPRKPAAKKATPKQTPAKTRAPRDPSSG
jgi:hypothetical protein